ncbi:hypothetical protein GCM10023189_28940 [Nibrella saemangeumensis]|uniref:Lipoprotein n=1 Tax=Nibrella saemangeumensis TaxID=1084526 RepID=A0ABP8MXF0_9BACT
MKRISILLLALLSACSTTQQLPQNTPVDEGEYYMPSGSREVARKRLLPDPMNGLGQTNDPSIRVNDIRLTSNYTVLYMTYTNGSPYSSGASSISFRPDAKLVAADGVRTYSFVKAEGIPLSPQDRQVHAAEKVDFVLYFKRLDTDVQEFAMFECKSDETTSCWNVVNMKVSTASTPKP